MENFGVLGVTRHRNPLCPSQRSGGYTGLGQRFTEVFDKQSSPAPHQFNPLRKHVGKTTVAEASRAYDLSPSEIEGWVDDAKRGMENALRANPLEIREQYEKQLKDLQEAYGEAMLELRTRKKLAALMEREDGQ